MTGPLHLPDLLVHRSADDVVERYAATADALDDDPGYGPDASEAGLNVGAATGRMVEVARTLPDGYIVRTFVPVEQAAG